MFPQKERRTTSHGTNSGISFEYYYGQHISNHIPTYTIEINLLIVYKFVIIKLNLTAGLLHLKSMGLLYIKYYVLLSFCSKALGIKCTQFVSQTVGYL